MQNTEKRTDRKTCPRCGKDFYCTVEAGCWCEKLYIPREALKELRCTYIDCLCPGCLDAYRDLRGN
ncbi:MAG: cysteine-rich CWC family protein [Bacteroidia bacterium]|nr:cysteine-rich CWC family protein [Bacteroidia bacterium]